MIILGRRLRIFYILILYCTLKVKLDISKSYVCIIIYVLSWKSTSTYTSLFHRMEGHVVFQYKMCGFYIREYHIPIQSYTVQGYEVSSRKPIRKTHVLYNIYMYIYSAVRGFVFFFQSISWLSLGPILFSPIPPPPPFTDRT